MSRAEERLGTETGRPGRLDRGRTRVAPPVMAHLGELLATADKPAMRDIRRDLAEFCEARGLRAPSRATVYNLLARVDAGHYRVGDLPPAPRATLYNLDDDTLVPGHQLAFHCFNYGGLAAMSFGAGLPWLCLYQAARTRGFRPRSLGVLRAVMRARGI